MAKFLEIIKKPASVATVTTTQDLKFLDSTSESYLLDIADVFEFRVDNFSKAGELDSLEEFLKRFTGLSLITPRHPSEGGVEPMFSDIGFRSEIYSQFQPYGAAIDIEIEHYSALTKTFTPSLPVVGSSHDFTDIPERSEFERKLQFCRACQIEVPKFAVTLKTTSSLCELLRITDSVSSEGLLISAMGMGEFGKVSRLALAKAGSCLNYGYLQRENAPGQWSAKDLKRLIREI